MKKSIKVLVSDESALVRQTLSYIINSDDQLEVIGIAADPADQVMSLEEMPRKVLVFF